MSYICALISYLVQMVATLSMEAMKIVEKCCSLYYYTLDGNSSRFSLNYRQTVTRFGSFSFKYYIFFANELQIFLFAGLLLSSYVVTLSSIFSSYVQKWRVCNGGHTVGMSQVRRVRMIQKEKDSKASRSGHHQTWNLTSNEKS